MKLHSLAATRKTAPIVMPPSSGGPSISVVQTSDTSERNDPVLGGRPNPASRGFLAEPEMGAVCVVVGDVIRQQSLQMAR